MLIAKDYKFEAAHVLPRHQGKCRRLHGHSYKVTITLSGDVDLATGFVLDYAEMDRVIDPIVDKLDHRFLNAFVQYPSAENIATYIAHQLYSKWPISFLPGTPGMRLQVIVRETLKTAACWDSYTKQDSHRFLDDNDMEWRAPEIEAVKTGHITNIPLALGSYMDSAAEAERHLITALVGVEQLTLYVESMHSAEDTARLLREATIHANDLKEGPK